MTMMWIAYNPSIHDHKRNREQFNGDSPAWGESLADHLSKQNVDVPNVGDRLALRMGSVIVESRRLESPESDTDENGDEYYVTPWYWTIIVKASHY